MCTGGHAQLQQRDVSKVLYATYNSVLSKSSLDHISSNGNGERPLDTANDDSECTGHHLGNIADVYPKHHACVGIPSCKAPPQHNLNESDRPQKIFSFLTRCTTWTFNAAAPSVNYGSCCLTGIPLAAEHSD